MRARKTFHLFLLLLLASLQAAQAAFSGATLCREGNGEVSLEWSQGGQCEGPGEVAVPCANKAGRTESEHCDACLDIPVPSDESAKSFTGAPGAPILSASAPLESVLREPSHARSASAPVSRRQAAARLGSIRLLI